MTLCSTPFDVYFWEPSISPHKLDLFKEVAHRAEVGTVWYISQQGLPAERSAQGWAVETQGVAADHIILSPSPAEIEEVVRRSTERSIHLFSGMHHVPTIVEGLRQCVTVGRRFAIMSEPRASEGLIGIARFVHSWVSERELRRNAGFVLAIGRNGPGWFKSVGYPAGRIFQFAYFLPPPAAVPEVSVPSDGRLRVTWIARLVKNKGLSYFLDAISQVRRPISVRLIGVGPMADRVRDACAAATFPMAYLGAVPMGTISSHLAETDVLVLPSITTDDGWGAVVSEALMAGVAVITTSKVGASACIRSAEIGDIAPARSAKGLALALERVEARSGIDPAARARRRDWALRHLTGQVGAQYLIDIIDHVYGEGQRPPSLFEG